MKKIIICLFAMFVVPLAWATEYKYQEINVQAIEQSIPDAQLLGFRAITNTKLYGDVTIGSSYYPTHIAVYDRVTGLVDLVPIPATELRLRGANNNGVMVVSGPDWSVYTLVSYYLYQDGSYQKIPDPMDTFGGSDYIGFGARAITDSHIVAGGPNNPANMRHGIIYVPEGTPEYETVEIPGVNPLRTDIYDLSNDGNFAIVSTYVSGVGSQPYLVNRNTNDVVEITHPDQREPGRPIGVTNDGLALLYIFFPSTDPNLPWVIDIRTYTYDYSTEQFEQILAPVDCSDHIVAQAMSDQGEIYAQACGKFYVLSPKVAPPPKELLLNKLRLKSYKKKGIARIRIAGEFEPPELLIANGQSVQYTVTIKFHGVMLDGYDLVLEEIGEATAYDKRNYMVIKKDEDKYKDNDDDDDDD